MKAIDNRWKPFPLSGKISVCRNVSNNSFLMLKLVLRILSFQETKMKLNFMFLLSLVTREKFHNIVITLIIGVELWSFLTKWTSFSYIFKSNRVCWVIFFFIFGQHTFAFTEPRTSIHNTPLF